MDTPWDDLTANGHLDLDNPENLTILEQTEDTATAVDPFASHYDFSIMNYPPHHGPGWPSVPSNVFNRTDNVQPSHNDSAYAYSNMIALPRH